MVEPFTGSTVLLALAALAAFAVAVIAIRIAIKLAVRVGLVAAVVLAALYATAENIKIGSFEFLKRMERSIRLK